MKKIDFSGNEWFKIIRPILPFKLGGKWYLWRKIKITYIIMNNGNSLPIKTELLD